jgi:hypothetical protein
MRGATVSILMVVCAVLAAGCGSADPSAAPAATSPSAAATSASPALEDVKPTLVNPAGSPACGYFTRVETQAASKYTYLSFAVAVVPGGTLGEVALAYEIEGDPTSHIARFGDGEIRAGKSTLPSGRKIKYLMADLGIVRVDAIPSQKLTAFLNKPRIITVTVDPQNQIKEPDEDNNVLRLRVTPPSSRQSIAVEDNRCTVLKP